MFVCHSAGSVSGQRTLVGQLDADGFVYADTPIHTDADLTVECFLGRFTDAVDGCAAGELDGRLSRTPFEKLEQFLYDGDDRDILARYSRGSLVEKPFTE